jgi:hypothetical protein
LSSTFLVSILSNKVRLLVEIVSYGPRNVVLSDLLQGIERCGKDCPVAIGLCWDIDDLRFVSCLLELRISCCLSSRDHRFGKRSPTLQYTSSLQMEFSVLKLASSFPW